MRLIDFDIDQLFCLSMISKDLGTIEVIYYLLLLISALGHPKRVFDLLGGICYTNRLQVPLVHGTPWQHLYNYVLS